MKLKASDMLRLVKAVTGEELPSTPILEFIDQLQELHERSPEAIVVKFPRNLGASYCNELGFLIPEGTLEYLKNKDEIKNLTNELDEVEEKLEKKTEALEDLICECDKLKTDLAYCKEELNDNREEVERLKGILASKERNSASLPRITKFGYVEQWDKPTEE